MPILTFIVIFIIVAVIITAIIYLYYGSSLQIFHNRYYVLSIVILIAVIGLIYFLSNARKDAAPNIQIEEGRFMWLNQEEWEIKPSVPLSSDTLLGGLIFDDERYDPKIDPLYRLYLGKNISV